MTILSNPSDIFNWKIPFPNVLASDLKDKTITGLFGYVIGAFGAGELQRSWSSSASHRLRCQLWSACRASAVVGRAWARRRRIPDTQTHTRGPFKKTAAQHCWSTPPVAPSPFAWDPDSVSSLSWTGEEWELRHRHEHLTAASHPDRNATVPVHSNSKIWIMLSKFHLKKRFFRHQSSLFLFLPPVSFFS